MSLVIVPENLRRRINSIWSLSFVLVSGVRSTHRVTTNKISPVTIENPRKRKHTNIVNNSDLTKIWKLSRRFKESKMQTQGDEIASRVKRFSLETQIEKGTVIITQEITTKLRIKKKSEEEKVPENLYKNQFSK